MLGKVEFLIDSNSKVTTAEIIKALKKKIPLTPRAIQQTIIAVPKYKYLITLKKTPVSNITNTYIQSSTRQRIKKELTCDQVLFKDNTIEIWSSKEINLAKLENEELLKREKTPPYGGGVQSVKLLKK